MISNVVCDTNVVSMLFRRDPRLGDLRSHLLVRRKVISVVTVGEIMKGVIGRRWGEDRIGMLNDHLASYGVLGIDREVGEEWGELAALCERLGRRKEDNDLWIAATARHHGLPLATFDRAFDDVPGLTLIRDDGSEFVVPE